MNIDHLTNLVQASVKGLSNNFLIPGKDAFTENLKIGQVVKGEVNQALGEGRYLVNFKGIEKVIESTLPFSKGDILYGRVIGVGDNVELERVRSLNDKSAQPEQFEKIAAAEQGFTNKHDRLIGELFAKYQATLPKSEQATLFNQVKLAGNANLMALAGLVINKVGLPQSPELLQSIYQVVNKKSGRLDFSPSLKELPEATLLNSARQQNKHDNGLDLSRLINEFSVQLPESRFKEKNSLQSLFDNSIDDESDLLGEQDDDEQREEQKESINLARWMLNTQVDGAVSHRIFSIPLNIDGQVTEINVALFDQEKKYVTKDGIRYRQIVFSLESEHLGLVEVTVNIANQHLRVQIMTDDHSNTEFLAQYMTHLKNTVSSIGWELDEISYGTKINDTDNAIVRSIVEHYVSQDSLSRLV